MSRALQPPRGTLPLASVALGEAVKATEGVAPAVPEREAELQAEAEAACARVRAAGGLATR